MARIAVVVDEMFEDSEFRVPYDELRAAGHDVLIVGLEKGKTVYGKKGKEAVTIEAAGGEVKARSFDALVIPGGYSPDMLRVDEAIVHFVRDMLDSGKPVAAICHAGWLLAEAGSLAGRTLTSWPSIKTDLVNAGATWVDREVVEDGNLITSRKPDDLPAFTKVLLDRLTAVEPT